MNPSIAHEFSDPAARSLTVTAVIATRNRAKDLEACLRALQKQVCPVAEIIVVDSSNEYATECVVEEWRTKGWLPLTYRRSAVASAARQRNDGAALASGDLVLFLDDDVELQQLFVKEIVRVFANDAKGEIGGVSGTIAGQGYCPPSLSNRLAMLPAVGSLRASLSGRVVGPGANFFPEDKPEPTQTVEWLMSGATAYRREVFNAFRFADSFVGYSFAEDLHLSARVGREYRLVNSTKARCAHKDLGCSTHRDWVGYGEMMMVNRHAVMAYVLGKSSIADYLRLFYYEAVYGSIAFLWSKKDLKKTLQVLWGRIRGFVRVIAGRSPHAAH